jgi:outer membrane murein-binding lipoprotein Lpp
MAAIVLGCTLVAGGVSAAEISMLNSATADPSVSTGMLS